MVEKQLCTRHLGASPPFRQAAYLSRRASIASTYKQAGVDIDQGNALIETIKPAVNATNRPGVLGGIGGFGGLFDLAATNYQDPILVAATDGVGTKLKLALAANSHRSIGIDLVAMCVNDLIVQGAEPLFFLDYFATGKLDIAIAREVIEGIAEGCQQAGCALIGGETAEMPGLYHGRDFDLAGFSVGAVERGAVLPSNSIEPGDIVLGLGASGVHSNGFSLVNRILADTNSDIEAPAPFSTDTSLADILLTPTRIYVASCLKAIGTGKVKGLAHITGGGLAENLARILPETCHARLDADLWTMPPVFSWLARAGQVEAKEMARVYNCGIGMTLIVAAADAPDVSDILAQAGEEVFTIGTLEKRPADGNAAIVENLTFET